MKSNNKEVFEGCHRSEMLFSIVLSGVQCVPSDFLSRVEAWKAVACVISMLAKESGDK